MDILELIKRYETCTDNHKNFMNTTKTTKSSYYNAGVVAGEMAIIKMIVDGVDLNIDVLTSYSDEQLEKLDLKIIHTSGLYKNEPTKK